MKQHTSALHQCPANDQAGLNTHCINKLQRQAVYNFIQKLVSLNANTIPQITNNSHTL